MTTLGAYIEAVGVRGPGLADWASAAPILRGVAPYDSVPTELPPPEQLPSAERRRAVPVVRIAFAAAEQATRMRRFDGPLPTVFASSGGDGLNYHQICETLASDDKKISPTRFHNSVHNAPSGYWSIATRDMATSNVLCAHDASFGAGLLDALAQIACDGGHVMLVAYESDYPEPLHSVRPLAASFGMALVLAAQPSPHALARLDVNLDVDLDVDFDRSLERAPPDTFADAALETLRRGVPSARSLPLLAALASVIAGDTEVPLERIVEYQPDSSLHVTVSPC